MFAFYYIVVTKLFQIKNGVTNGIKRTSKKDIVYPKNDVRHNVNSKPSCLNYMARNFCDTLYRINAGYHGDG